MLRRQRHPHRSHPALPEAERTSDWRTPPLTVLIHDHPTVSTRHSARYSARCSTRAVATPCHGLGQRCCLNGARCAASFDWVRPSSAIRQAAPSVAGRQLHPITARMRCRGMHSAITARVSVAVRLQPRHAVSSTQVARCSWRRRRMRAVAGGARRPRPEQAGHADCLGAGSSARSAQASG